MSISNIYHEFEDRVKEKWIKTVPAKVAGTRLDPYDDRTRITFLLETEEKDFGPDGVTFDYDNEVIELYSDREVTVFKRANKAQIRAGLLARYDGSPKETETSQAMSDSDLLDIIENAASGKPYCRTNFKEELAKINSRYTIGRLRPLLKDRSMPLWVEDEISKREKEIGG